MRQHTVLWLTYKLHNYKSVIIHTSHQRSPLNFAFFTSFHFRRFITVFQIPSLQLTITFLTLFLKICDLQGRVTSASAGSWFQSFVVLFTKEYFPLSVLCFLALIFRSWYSCSGSMFIFRSPVMCNLGHTYSPSFLAIGSHVIMQMWYKNIKSYVIYLMWGHT